MKLRLMVVALFLLLAACSKVNQENYAKLESGMTRAEVETILGSPSECSSALGVSSCLWGDDRSNISIQFAGDRVIVISGQGLR